MALEHKEIPYNDSKNPPKANSILEVQYFLTENYQIRFNLLTQSIEIKKHKQPHFSTLNDRMLNTIWIDLQMKGIKCSDRTLDKILRSEYTESYHPLEVYFNELEPHDGNDYIGQLINTIEITDLQVGEINIKQLWRAYFQKWLVASVANCLVEGVNQTCLILVGNQGSGKTTWLNKLCPESMLEFLVCGHINPSLTYPSV